MTPYTTCSVMLAQELHITPDVTLLSLLEREIANNKTNKGKRKEMNKKWVNS